MNAYSHACPRPYLSNLFLGQLASPCARHSSMGARPRTSNPHFAQGNPTQPNIQVHFGVLLCPNVFPRDQLSDTHVDAAASQMQRFFPAFSVFPFSFETLPPCSLSIQPPFSLTLGSVCHCPAKPHPPLHMYIHVSGSLSPASSMQSVHPNIPAPSLLGSVQRRLRLFP